MNEVCGYARPVPRGFWAMIRLHRDAKPKPLLAKGGSPIVYTCEADALRAVLAHLCSYFNSPMVRDGEKISGSARAQAERIFTKGKTIEVTRIGGEA